MKKLFLTVIFGTLLGCQEAQAVVEPSRSTHDLFIDKIAIALGAGSAFVTYSLFSRVKQGNIVLRSTKGVLGSVALLVTANIAKFLYERNFITPQKTETK